MVAVQAKQLTKVYRCYSRRVDVIMDLLHINRRPPLGRRPALEDVSFTVEAGECVGVIGQNGAGKSTLLKLLAGMSAPTSGSLEVQGKVTTLLELGTGFHPDFTGVENVRINGMLLGLSRLEVEARLPAIVEFAELGDVINDPVRTYSSGMQSRLAFAITTALQADVLLIDEVLAVGDAYFVDKCIRHLQGFLRDGGTALVVSHNAFFIRRLCQKAMWLHGGRLMEYGLATGVCSSYEDLIREDESREILRRSQQLWKVRSRGETADAVEPSPRPPGPDQIRIADVQVLDTKEQECACFLVGDRLMVRVQYFSTIEYANPSVGVTVERADGLIACASSTLEERFEVGLVGKGTGYFDAVYDPLLLGPGLYKITVSITLNDPLAMGDTNFDRLRHVREFKVDARGCGYSVAVAHPVTWRHVRTTGEIKA